MFHVQPVDPYFCATCPITSCAEIIQHTEQTGVLEFDLFYHDPFVVPPQIYSLVANIEWSPLWTPLEAEICGGGEGSIELTGPNRATVDVIWPDCPQWGFDGVFLVARFVFDVGGPGSIWTTDWLEEHINLGCPPNLMHPFDVLMASTTAGTCSFCPPRCDRQDPCHAYFYSGSIELEVAQGSVIETTATVYCSGRWGVEPCIADLTTTVEWMSWNESQIWWLSSGEVQELALTIDAQNLDPGTYEGWGRAAARCDYCTETECVGCIAVDLTVLDTQDIAEDEPSRGPDDRGSASSWGQIKATFR
jgi:hypothetical protein